MSSPSAILCIDFDGTLVDSQMCIHPKDVKILQDFPAAIQLVITTGRNLQSFKSILNKNGLLVNKPLPVPGVFMNGGAAYLPGELICCTHTFPPETRRDLIDLTRDFPETAFTFFALDAVYLVNPNSFGRQISHDHHLSVLEIDLVELPDEMIKVMVLEPETNVMEKIRRRSQGLSAEMAASLSFCYEINPLGVNKAASLTALLKRTQLDNLPIFVAGDAENDLALFQLANTSFAPTTAHPKVIELADHLIQRQEEGLLAQILTHIRFSINNL